MNVDWNDIKFSPFTIKRHEIQRQMSSCFCFFFLVQPVDYSNSNSVWSLLVTTGRYFEFEMMIYTTGLMFTRLRWQLYLHRYSGSGSGRNVKNGCCSHLVTLWPRKFRSMALSLTDYSSVHILINVMRTETQDDFFLSCKSEKQTARRSDPSPPLLQRSNTRGTYQAWADTPSAYHGIWTCNSSLLSLDPC